MRVDEATSDLARKLQLALEGRATVTRKIRTLIAECGFRRRTPDLVESLQAALEAAGIYPRPKVTTWCSLDTFVELSRQPYDQFEFGLPFASEARLRSFLIEHWRSIPELAHLSGLVVEGSVGAGRCDIIARDSSGDYVVVELKVNSGGESVASQLFRYLEALRPRAEREGRGLRGIAITAARNDPELRELGLRSKATGIPVQWYCYELAFTLHPMQVHEDQPRGALLR